MSFSVNTNAGAMAALRTLNMTQNALSKTQSRIESGFKVNSAKDDPSTFVIAQGMRGDVGGLKAVKEGLNFGKASINMASAAAKQISDTLTKLQEKATQAGNQSLDVAKLQAEADQLVSQINTIASSATLGGINLLDVAQSSTTGMNVLSGLAGAGATTSIQIGQENATATGLGINNIDLTQQTFRMAIDDTFAIADDDFITLEDGSGRQVVFEFNTSSGALVNTADEANNVFVVNVEIDPTQSTLEMLDVLKAKVAEYGFSMNTKGAEISFNHGSGMGAASATTFVAPPVSEGVVAGAALTAIDAAKQTIGDIMSRLGASSNRLDAQQEFTQVLIDTFEEGVGILVDANLAEESAKLQALQTKEQLGVQSLSIANQRPQSIMSLFK